MEYKDIRQSVLYQIDNIDDLKNLCYVDKQFYHLCSQKEFWIHWYNKHQIKFINTYDNFEDWLKEYYHVLEAYKIAVNLIYGNKNSSYSTTIKLTDIKLLYNEDLEFYELNKNQKIKAVIFYKNNKFVIIYFKSIALEFTDIPKLEIINYIPMILSKGYKFHKLH